LYSAKKGAKHGLNFISESILDQMSIALKFIISTPEFERALVKQIVGF